MGGFKEGSVDGWGDEEEDEAQGSATDSTEAGVGTGMHRDEPTTSPVVEESTPRLPWIHRRSSITDGRENTKQLHLQDTTVEVEREQKSKIEDLLGESVKKADLREAALLVGLKHIDETADQLREWGYAVE
ncbi:hypothetical protein [Halorubrum vacuolatum]|uniref:FERM domain-containing protein n=1 Tax=Halorubrum vacuolatum TaxID=63740 RepID=A0A238YDM0_HALVU|nr:hypothetical protein [Halorubrum vacuolatum]SNR69062.1 hypothetical protein SAMN06264855_1397 [Halorubrum vacuolatum]